MPQFTPRQREAIRAIREHVTFWKARQKIQKKQQRYQEETLLNTGHTEAFIRNEVLPVLEGVDFRDLHWPSSSDTNSSSSFSSSSSSSLSASTSTSSSAPLSAPDTDQGHTTSSSLDLPTTISSDPSTGSEISARHRILQMHVNLRLAVVKRRARQIWSNIRHRARSHSPSTTHSHQSASETSDSGSSSDHWADDELDDEDLSLHDTSDSAFAGKSARRVVDYIKSLYRQRYLKPRDLYKRPPAHLPHVLNVWKLHQPDQFRENLRVDPATFDALITALKDDPIFYTEGGRDQAPVDHQVAVALYRFGHHGNGVSLQQVANWCGYSKGWVKVATKRVLVAVLRPEFAGKYVRPPTDAEKEEAKRWVEAHSCSAWRDGYCMVDGTLVILAERPFWYGESYFDRKCNYSLNFQIINLPNLRIIDFSYGFTGSTHDATAWEQTAFVKNTSTFLSGEEFIWADSAYPIEEWLVAPYKAPERNDPKNLHFNTTLSRVRIRSEHAIGFLKGRFQSLKGVPVRIRDAPSHKYATFWGVCCIVLHNFAIECEAEQRRTVETDTVLDAMMREGMRGPVGDDAEVDAQAQGAAVCRAHTLQAGRERRRKLQVKLQEASDARRTRTHLDRVSD